MRLNGIYAWPGTVIGVEFHSGRFVSVDASTGALPDAEEKWVRLRFSTGEELSAIGTREPRSVCEHEGIPLRMTPYGPAKIFGPRPRVKPRRISKSEAKRFLSAVQYRPPDVIDG